MRKTLYTALALFCLPGLAWGGRSELTTPILNIDPDAQLMCLATNLHHRQLDVHVDVFDRFGTVVAEVDRALLPNASGGALFVNPTGVAESFRCVFSFKASKRLIRAMVCGRPAPIGSKGCTTALRAE